MTKVSFGTVIQGTHRSEDLLEAFADELERLAKSDAKRVGKSFIQRLAEGDLYGMFIDRAREVDPDSEEASELINDHLIDALNDFAPAFSYFGAHAGDGSDFGFWPDIDSLDRAVFDGEVLKLDAGDEIPEDYKGDVMFVNDHGNVSFGYRYPAGAEFKETWACV